MISEHQIDLVYVNAPRLLPAAGVAARLRSVPLVFHCHNRLVQRSNLIAAGEALRLSRAHVIACCKFAADPIRSYVQPERLSILYNGVERLALGMRGFGQQLLRIGVIGRIEPEKGQLNFVRAARAILSRYPRCRFFVAGAPLFSNSDYLDQVSRLSRGLPVTFLGWRDDIAAVFAGLDLLVVPSSHVDSAPRVIFEAFSSCVPVVAFPSGGIPEIITDGENGFLASTTESQALADRICSIIAMPSSHVSAVVQRAWKRWQQEYTVELYQERVANLLLNAVATY
jgi:glycosyltransferase involved in cell wall biosynthesis